MECRKGENGNILVSGSITADNAATGIRDEELKRKAEEQISPHDQFSPGCPEVWLFSIL